MYDPFSPHQPPMREVFHTDRLAVARNIATNGRLFCVMAFIVSLALFMVTRDRSFAVIALMFTAVVGATTVVDPLPAGRLRTALAGGVHGLAAVIFLYLVMKIG